MDRDPTAETWEPGNDVATDLDRAAGAAGSR